MDEAQERRNFEFEVTIELAGSSHHFFMTVEEAEEPRTQLRETKPLGAFLRVRSDETEVYIRADKVGSIKI